MNAATIQTPSKSLVDIVPRRVELPFEDIDERFFFASNSILSTMFVALSGIFPPGEKEFIRSVRLHMDQVEDEVLQRHVKEFASQEAHHSHQHRLVNDIFDELGYPATAITENLRVKLQEWESTRSIDERLAVTVVMEHLTAAMAHYALTHPENLADVPESIRELIYWHSIEEIEHKSVAFDVYMATVGDRGLLRRWLVQQLVLFPISVAIAQVRSLHHLGHVPSLDELTTAAQYLFGRDGLVTRVVPHALQLMRPDFHPWDLDDSALVERWKGHLAARVH